MEPEEFSSIVKLKKKPPPRPPPPTVVDEKAYVRKLSSPRVDTPPPARRPVVAQKCNPRVTRSGGSDSKLVALSSSSKPRSKSENCLVSMEELEKKIHSLTPARPKPSPPQILTQKHRHYHSKSQELSSNNNCTKTSPSQRQKPMLSLEHKGVKSSKPTTGRLFYPLLQFSNDNPALLESSRPSSGGPVIRPPPVKLDLTSKHSYVNRPAPPKPQPASAKKENSPEQEIYAVPDHSKPLAEEYMVTPYAEFIGTPINNQTDEDAESSYVQMNPSSRNDSSSYNDPYIEIISSSPTDYMPLVFPETNVEQNPVLYTDLRSTTGAELYDFPNKAVTYQQDPTSSQEGYLALSTERDKGQSMW